MNFRRQISLAAMRAASEYANGGGIAAWHKFADELNRGDGEEERPDLSSQERRGMDPAARLAPRRLDALEHGLYILRWKEGGGSLAAVGYDSAGRNWYAPTNWISGPCFDWSKVESVKPILLERYWRESEEE